MNNNTFSFFAVLLVASILLWYLLLSLFSWVKTRLYYRELKEKFGDHEAVFIDWLIDGPFDKKVFRRRVYCPNPRKTYKKVEYQVGSENFVMLSYAALPWELVEALTEEANVYASIWLENKLVDMWATTLGDWGDEPKPFGAICIRVPTSIDRGTLRKFGMIW